MAQIDAVVSARLGPTRVPGNAQPACFNRQVAMYLAARLGGWRTTAIGKFYNGRDHSTVCYGIQRVEALRETDPEVDPLIAGLKRKLALSSQSVSQNPGTESEHTGEDRNLALSASEIETIAERIPVRLLESLRSLRDAGLKGR